MHLHRAAACQAGLTNVTNNKMRLIIIILLLSPLLSDGQSIVNGSERINNIYRRDSSVIQKYNLEFANMLKTADSVIADGDVKAYLSKRYSGNKNIQDLTMHVVLTLQAKDNRSRLVLGTVTYTAEGGECPLSGTLGELHNTKKCRYYASQVIDDYKLYVVAIYEKYKSFLKDKAEDGNW